MNVTSLMFSFVFSQLLDNIEEILVAIRQTQEGKYQVRELLGKHAGNRDRLERDYREALRMGRALLERMSLPVITQEGYVHNI